MLEHPSGVVERFGDLGLDVVLAEDLLLHFSVAGHAERGGRDVLFEELPSISGAVDADSESTGAGRSDLEDFDMAAFDVALLYGDAHGGWFLG